jgi:type II secretory pathway pseudopilin PulG
MSRATAIAAHGHNGNGRIGGATLIELVIFIIIIAIVTTGAMSAFNRLLTGATTAHRLDEAAYLARQRLELILPQRQVLGFTGFTAATFDPCTSAPASTQPVCTAIPSGYTVTSSLADNWNGDPAYKVITVTVSGNGAAQLQALVGDY